MVRMAYPSDFGIIRMVPFLSIMNMVRTLEFSKVLTTNDAMEMFKKNRAFSRCVDKMTYICSVGEMIRHIKLHRLSAFQILYVVYVIIQLSRDMIVHTLTSAEGMTLAEYSDCLVHVLRRLHHVVFYPNIFSQHDKLPVELREDYHKLSMMIRKHGLDTIELIECLIDSKKRQACAHQKLDIIREELMMRTWHPTRVQHWCLDTDETSDIFH